MLSKAKKIENVKVSMKNNPNEELIKNLMQML
jgi:hypothetical protein